MTRLPDTARLHVAITTTRAVYRCLSVFMVAHSDAVLTILLVDLPDVPQFDEFLVQILGLLGVSGGILVLAALAFAVQSWYDGIRMTIRLGRRARRGVASGAAALMRLSPIRGVSAMIITLVVPVAQALAVGLCFLGGNYVSMVFDNSRWVALTELVNVYGVEAFTPERLSQVLRLDWASGGYVVLAGFVLIHSYRLARHHRDLTGAGALLAWPATLLGLLAAVALTICLVLVLLIMALTLVTEADDSGSALREGLTNIVPLLVGGSICAVYYGACQAAVHASRLVVRVWMPRTSATTLA